MSDYPTKVCYNCNHCIVDSGWGGTDVTPGDDPTIACGLQHWNLFAGKGVYSGSPRELRECLESAMTCEDFSRAPWAPVNG